VQRNPNKVLFIGILAFTFCCVGLKNVTIETDLVKLWVSRNIFSKITDLGDKNSRTKTHFMKQNNIFGFKEHATQKKYYEKIIYS
jgi:hypothetical protein